MCIRDRKKDRLGSHADLNLAAQQIRNRGRRAFVWNEDDIAGGSDPDPQLAHVPPLVRT